MKFAFVAAHQDEFPVRQLCQVLGVSPSGYYAWRKPSERTRQEPRLEAEVPAAHRRARESFGPECPQQHLEKRVQIGVHRIRRLRRNRSASASRLITFAPSNHLLDGSQYLDRLPVIHAGQVFGSTYAPIWTVTLNQSQIVY